MKDAQHPSRKYDEGFAIAEGLERLEIERRARRAFGYANECRARYVSGPDLTKRAAAIQAALAWRNTLRYLDATGAHAFWKADYDAWKRTLRQRLRTVTAPIDPFRWHLVFKFNGGAQPVEFYPLPEEPTYADAAELPDSALLLCWCAGRRFRRAVVSLMPYAYRA
jgi:hypothetical protein